MNAISRELSSLSRVNAADGNVADLAAADDDLAARAAILRAYRLTCTALPPATPTKMPPQAFEFWTTPVAEAWQALKQRLSGRRTLPGAADLSAG